MFLRARRPYYLDMPVPLCCVLLSPLESSVRLDGGLLGLLSCVRACFQPCYELKHQSNLLWTSMKLQFDFSSLSNEEMRRDLGSAVRIFWVSIDPRFVFLQPFELDSHKDSV